MIACNCKGIPEGELRKALEAVNKPIQPRDAHDMFPGDKANCCCHCRTPRGNRLFVEIVNAHNARFIPPDLK